MNPRPKRDRTDENFLRATKNIMHRGDEMSRRYGVDICVVLRRKGRYYDYCSTQDTSFLSLGHPPPRLGLSGLREGSPSSRNRASALGSSIFRRLGISSNLSPGCVSATRLPVEAKVRGHRGKLHFDTKYLGSMDSPVSQLGWLRVGKKRVTTRPPSDSFGLPEGSAASEHIALRPPFPTSHHLETQLSVTG